MHLLSEKWRVEEELTATGLKGTAGIIGHLLRLTQYHGELTLMERMFYDR